MDNNRLKQELLCLDAYKVLVNSVREALAALEQENAQESTAILCHGLILSEKLLSQSADSFFG